MSDDLRGRFLWYELLTSDPGAAIDFYTSLIGWDTAPFEVGEQEYTMWMQGEIPVGGLMQLPEEAVAGGAPPHWLSYIGTEDVDATAGQATELGGTIVYGPEDIATVGRFAVLTDPQGAVISLYKPEQEAPPETAPEPGRFSWHELATADAAAAFGFYSALFGWEKADEMDMGEAGLYHIYGRGGPPLGGIFDKPAEMPVSAWLYYIQVDDVNETAERTKELGGQVLNGPMEVPGGDHIAHCSDLQGAMFAVHSVG